MSARQLEDQLGLDLQDGLAATQKLRRSMVDPDREPLEGVVEVDQAEIPFRECDTFFEPGSAGKIFVIGAVEVIDRDINQCKPRHKHAQYGSVANFSWRLAGYDRWKRFQRHSKMIEFKGGDFERDVILWRVRWYVAYPISYRRLEEMMEERGVEVDHPTLNR